MKILLNNQEIDVDDQSTIQSILKRHSKSEKVAVFVNGQLVLYSEYAVRRLKPDDRMAFFKPLSGG